MGPEHWMLQWEPKRGYATKDGIMKALKGLKCRGLVG
jgi:hypothetical protein